MKIFTRDTECAYTFMNLSLMYVLNPTMCLHERNLENHSGEDFNI